MTYKFHAAPPAHQWLNDPNGLYFADGRYRLLAQHAADPPDFKQIGWGAFSSKDMLDWQWDGIAVPPNRFGYAYSGSVARGTDDTTDFFLTRHDPTKNSQSQEWRAADGAIGVFGSSGKNCRDPFVFQCAGLAGWYALIARPCDWAEWRNDPPSTLEIWQSPDRRQWSPAGTIGPWHPVGIMWEVPIIVDFGDAQVLILSLIDRRNDTSACSVRYWLGRFTGNGFAAEAVFPQEGVLLDHGPDFYAAIPNVVQGWPTTDRVIVGWASEWSTARTRQWQGDVYGGPITMPRLVRLDQTARRLRQEALPDAIQFADIQRWTDDCWQLEYRGTVLAKAMRSKGCLQVGSLSSDVDWGAETNTQVVVYRDHDLVEVFFAQNGLVATFFAADK